MSDEKYVILNLFKSNPNENLSTSYIARKIYPEEYEEILDVLSGDFSTKEEVKEARRKKSKVHRRVLHHLNKMVDEDILKVSKRGKNGEKYFEPDIESGEEIVYENVRKNKIEISKPILPSLPIENYEAKGIIKRYKREKWITKLDSVMLETSKFENKNLYRAISSALDCIKDVLGLNSFEFVLKRFSTDSLNKLLRNLSKDLNNFNKSASLIIDFSRLETQDRDKLSAILNHFDDYPRLNMVFEVSSQDLQEQSKFMENIMPALSRSEIYFRNKNVGEVPYMVGEAGPYTFEENLWKKHKEKGERANSFCCSQSSVFVDFKKFFEEENSIDRSRFREVIEKSYRSLFLGNNIQRKEKERLFEKMLQINQEGSNKEFFIYGRNYLRFWCTEALSYNFDDSLVPNLLGELKKDTDEFCAAESTIYKSCGMPMEFKIAFSPAWGPYPNQKLSRNNFKRLKISGIEDLYGDDMKEEASSLSSLSSIYDGGNIVELFRTGDYSESDIFQELNVLMNSYSFSLFKYTLGDVDGRDTKINRFLK